MSGFKLTYLAHDPVKGNNFRKTIEVPVEAYKAAADKKMCLRQYLRHVANDYVAEAGDVFDQMAANSGLFDGNLGVGPALTMADMANLTLADNFRKPDGSDNSLGARLLYPQVILETLQANAHTDPSVDFLSIWNSMIAVNRNIVGTLAEQPIIDTRAPESSRSGRIAQLAEPEIMVSITTGQKSYRIPTYSIGLLISDQALGATTIDLVRVVMEAQARGERIARAQQQMRQMVLGDPDVGIDALPVVAAGSFDDAITADGVITKKAYIKWLYSKHNRYNINRLLGGIDEAFVLDNALLPTISGPDNSKIGTPWNGVNLGIENPAYLPVEEETFGAGLIVGLDTRYAIQRVVNVSAGYDAIEEYVMRRATAFRVDFGEIATRLYDDAWSVLSLTQD